MELPNVPASADASRLSRRRLLALGAGAALAGPLLSASGANALPGQRTTPSRRVASSNLASVLRVADEPTASFDPLTRLGGTRNYTFADPLVLIVPGNPDPQPSLAVSFEREDDTSAVFTLREGVLFHDGTELTADDVKFTIEYSLAEGLALESFLSGIESVEVIDPLTFRVTTAEPDALLIKRMGLVFPVPQAAYESMGTDAFGLKPIGTGPWQVREIDIAGQRAILDRFDDYWGDVPLMPELHLIGFSDLVARHSALVAGELDIATGLPPTVMQNTASNVTVEPVQVGSPRLLAINTNNEPMNNVLVRQALQSAIDMETIIAVVLQGVGTPLNGQIPGPDCVGHNPDFVNSFPYDPDRARELLAEAGYPDGFKTTIGTPTADAAVCEAVAGYLREVGIDTTVQAMESSVWLEAFYNGSDLPMFIRGVNYSPIFDAELSFRWMTSPAVGSTDNANPGWIDETWDEMLAESRTILEPEEREQKLWDMTDYLNEQMPVLPLQSIEFVQGWTDKVKGLDLSTGFYLTFNTVEVEA